MTERMSDEELDRRAVYRVLLYASFNGDPRGVGAPGRVILCDRGPGDDRRYAVHWQNAATGGRHAGGYHAEASEAVEDFRRRLEREERYARARGEGPLTLESPGAPVTA